MRKMKDKKFCAALEGTKENKDCALICRWGGGEGTAGISGRLVGNLEDDKKRRKILCPTTMRGGLSLPSGEREEKKGGQTGRHVLRGEFGWGGRNNVWQTA